jgi:hypothetical protein
MTQIVPRISRAEGHCPFAMVDRLLGVSGERVN